VTSLTLVTLIVVAFGVLGRAGYGRALALGGITAAGASAVVFGEAVPTFFAVALGCLVLLGLRILGYGRAPNRVRQPVPPGMSLILGFLIWSTLVMLLAPFLFNGLPLVLPSEAVLTAGVYTSSNAAQIIYLALGVSVMGYLARSPTSGPEILGLTVGGCVVLSFWRYLGQAAGLPFPEGFFDNSPTFAYIESAPDDVERFRGILSEPAGLAGASLIAICYMVSRAIQVRGVRRVGALGLAAMAAYLGVISTSATFVVAGVAVVLIVALTFLFGFLMRWTSLSAVVSVVGCLLVIGAIWALPVVADWGQGVISEKLSSTSFAERSSADASSYDIFFDTFGFGVGLGAGRASSFVPTLLSTTGLIGTLLFAGAVATLLHRGGAVRAYRPVVWALVSLLVLKIVAGPDLSDTSGVLWISLGLLSHAALVNQSDADSHFSAGADVVSMLPAPRGR
jgi:hypothetical protein